MSVTSDGTQLPGTGGNANLSGSVYMYGPNDNPWTMDSAVNYFQDLDVNNKKQWNAIVDILDYLGYSTDYNTVQNYASRAIQWAANPDNFAAKKSVLDFFSLLPANSAGRAAAGRGSGTQKTVSSNISSTSDAAATINYAYQQTLGRSANDKEIAAFQKALNAMQAKNPSVSTATSVTSGKTGSSFTSSNVSSSGGFNAAQFATDWAKSRPEYAENFAATTFMNAVQGMLTGPSVEGRLING